MSADGGARVAAVVVDRDDSGGISARRVLIDAPRRPRHDEIVVATAYVGLCGSDLEQLRGSMPGTFRIQYPHVLGHEWSGTVLEAGVDAGFEPGDRVVGHGALGGNEWFGVTADGAMAERFPVPARMCFRIPETVSMRAAAVIEPLACVTTAFSKLRMHTAGDRATVYGLGAIGLCAVAMLAHSGVEVVGVDPSPLRRDLALRLGATGAVHPAARAPGGADLTIDASGAAAAQADAVEGAGHGATVLFLGVSRPKEVPVRLGLVQERDLTLISSTGADPALWPRALRFVERSGLDLSQLVTAVLPFEKVEEALHRAATPDGDVKVLLQPS